MIKIRRYYITALIVLVMGLIIGLTSLYILFFTTTGSKYIVKLQLARYSHYKNISIAKVEGSLSKKLVIYDLRMSGIRSLPPGSVLHIQSLLIKINLFTKKLDAELKNGVLTIPRSDAIYFAGTCNDGIFSLDVNGTSLELQEITGLVPTKPAAGSVSGVLRNIRISIVGRADALNVKGKLEVENLRYDDFVIEKCSTVMLDLTLNAGEKKDGIKGEMIVKDAAITLKNYPNIFITLDDSSIVLPGSGNNEFLLKTIRGKVKLPGSELILFNGSYQNTSMDLNFYSNAIDLKDAASLLKGKKSFMGLGGIVKNLDIRIKGTLSEQEVTGKFRIVKITRHDFSIVDCPGSINLRLKTAQEAITLNGEIMLNSGTVSGSNTAIIDLRKSKISFNGEIDRPALDIKGDSIVNGIKIDIALAGMLDKPDVALRSVPPMPEERLLLMLATGKNWTGAEDVLSKGKISPDLAKDFVSYFVFNEPGNSMGKKFGLDNISLKYDDKTQGVSIKNDITDKTLLSYGVEQPKEMGKEREITHKISAAQKLTENISISGERELTQSVNTTEKDVKPNDKVVVKYKAAF